VRLRADRYTAGPAWHRTPVARTAAALLPIGRSSPSKRTATGTPGTDRPLRFEPLADDIVALLDHLELPQADLFGTASAPASTRPILNWQFWSSVTSIPRLHL
jgi:hypothetical protein